jgi:adhesin transport system membrane fusion protein
MSALQQVVEQYKRQDHRFSLRIIMLLLTAFVCWALWADFEEVAIADGEVVPQEQIQHVQHLEGGIIEEIHVFEGDRVEEGQPLMQLNITPFMANSEELKIQLEALELKRARLQAEADGKEVFAFPQAFKNYRANLKNTEVQAFKGRQDSLQNAISQLQEQLSQRKLDHKQLQTERSAVVSNLALLREKFRISSDLVKDKLTSRLDHLQLQSDLRELEGRLKVIDVAIPRAAMAVKEAEEKLQGGRLTFRNEALQQLNDVEQAIERTRESLNQASDKVARTTIKSPITGTVKSMRTHTLGGVIQPGEIIMEIVPESENLIIEAKLNPNDIGFVKVGQPALVKVNTYDFSRYGGLQGEVISVSADSLYNKQTQQTYFLVKIRTAQNYVGSEQNLFPITSGMQVTADIKTGEKSVMSYLLKPVIKLRNESFRER